MSSTLRSNLAYNVYIFSPRFILNLSSQIPPVLFDRVVGVKKSTTQFELAFKDVVVAWKNEVHPWAIYLCTKKIWNSFAKA